MLRDFALANLAFFLLAGLCLAWAQWRTRPGPPFPGPRPVGTAFKIWLIVIWLVGFLLPLLALVVDGLAGGHRPVRIALGFYLLMFVAQVATEIFVWKRWRSPVWVIVPCLYLPWRLFQAWMGLQVVDGPMLSVVTLWALVLLWIINIGVHYSNIANTLRWDHHPPGARFEARSSPNPFVREPGT